MSCISWRENKYQERESNISWSDAFRQTLKALEWRKVSIYGLRFVKNILSIFQVFHI